MLKKVDLFGAKFRFPVMGQKSYKTNIGGLCSIFCFGVLLMFFFILGTNFYKRENPMVAFNKEFKTNYFNYTLNINNFNLGFRITDDIYNFKLFANIYEIEAHLITYRKLNNGTHKKISDEILDYHQCDFSNFDNSIYYKNFYCLDKLNSDVGLNLSGLWDSDEIKFIQIKVFEKNMVVDYLNSIQDSINDSSHLQNNDELTDRFSSHSTTNEEMGSFKKYNSSQIETAFNPNYTTNLGSYSKNNNISMKFPIQFLLQSFYFNPMDYYSPFKLHLFITNENLNNNYKKEISFIFKTGTVYDKIGWFSEYSEASSLIGLDRIEKDIMLADSQEESFNCIFKSNFLFDRIHESYYRRYIKVNELIADIGGILKMVIFACSVIVRFYNDHFLYKNFILNLLDKKMIFSELKFSESNHLNKKSYKKSEEFKFNPKKALETELNKISNKNDQFSEKFFRYNLNENKNLECSNNILNKNEGIKINFESSFENCSHQNILNAINERFSFNKNKKCQINSIYDNEKGINLNNSNISPSLKMSDKDHIANRKNIRTERNYKINSNKNSKNKIVRNHNTDNNLLKPNFISIKSKSRSDKNSLNGIDIKASHHNACDSSLSKYKKPSKQLYKQHVESKINENLKTLKKDENSKYSLWKYKYYHGSNFEKEKSNMYDSILIKKYSFMDYFLDFIKKRKSTSNLKYTKFSNYIDENMDISSILGIIVRFNNLEKDYIENS